MSGSRKWTFFSCISRGNSAIVSELSFLCWPGEIYLIRGTNECGIRKNTTFRDSSLGNYIQYLVTAGLEASVCALYNAVLCTNTNPVINSYLPHIKHSCRCIKFSISQYILLGAPSCSTETASNT